VRRLRGSQQQAVYVLITRLCHRHAEVERFRLVEAARRSDSLGIAASAIEPTVTRVLMRLFELNLIDVNDFGVGQDGYWLRERVHELARSSRSMAAKTSKDGGDVHSVSPYPDLWRRRDLAQRALDSGRFRDARRAVGFLEVRAIRLVRPTRRARNHEASNTESHTRP